jgi:ribonuclease G
VPCARARYNEEILALLWFRRKKRQHEHEAPESAATEVVAPAEPERVDTVDAEDAGTQPGDGTETPAKKRRRGSRGGRGRKRPGAPGGADGAVAGEAPARDAKDAKDAPGKKPDRERKDGSQRAERAADRRSRTQGAGSQRRRQAPRRAPLPAAKRELLIAIDVGEQRVAVLEDDRVAEVYLERPERRSIAGNIYLGVVDNVLPGMEAAFVEIGLEKNGFLYVDEIVVPELEGKRHGKKIQDLISRGEQLLVQAVKDPMKTKGARLTTEISLPGRFVVYVPNGEGLGVSRRLDDGERARLKEIIKGLEVTEGGVIVRTAADGASAEDIERDLVFLQRLWKTIQARAKGAKAPDLVYQEAELPLRIVRDLFAGDFEAAFVDNDRAHRRIVSYLKKTSPHMVERVHRYKDKEPLLEHYGVEREIASTLDRRVDLPSGGYLVFDYAEAFTVVDVNTGRFVGSRSKTSTQRLEDTITKNNLEAVKEVVRQLRLRDIGGIIVIDFIDMANPKNRASVEEALRDELERDRTKTYVVEISPLGLVEMTRQNVTDGPREILTRKCPTCAGDGIVVSDQTVAMQVERRLRALPAPGSRVQAYRVAVHPRILALLAGPGGARLAAIDEATRKRFFLVAADGHVHTDHLEVLAEGKLADLQPVLPIEEGATLEVKLGEVGLHDATAASGKVNGIAVTVANAARLVGRKVTVQVGLVLEGQVFATVVEPGETVGPITFESEAEKPTRAPARRKTGAVGSAATLETETDGIERVDSDELEHAVEADGIGMLDVEDEDGAETEVETEAETEVEVAAGDGVPPKKRTRRGSRGGKRHRKPPTGEAVAAAEGSEPTAVAEAADAAEDGGATRPVAAAAGLPVAADGDGHADPTLDGTPPAPARRQRAPRIHVPGDGAEVTVKRDSRAAAPAADGALTDTGEADVPGVGTAEAVDGEMPAPKKRTRRGTRGGRNRRKPAVAAANGDGADGDGHDEGAQVDARLEEAPAHEVEIDVSRPEPEAADDEPAREDVKAPVGVAAKESAPEGYVPMSEWLDDFNR